MQVHLFLSSSGHRGGVGVCARVDADNFLRDDVVKPRQFVKGLTPSLWNLSKKAIIFISRMG